MAEMDILFIDIKRSTYLYIIYVDNLQLMELPLYRL